MTNQSASNSSTQRQWYAKIKGKKRGPLSTNELHGLRIDGKINAQTIIWREGMPDWQPLEDVPELAALSGYAPAESKKTRSSSFQQRDMPPEMPADFPADDFKTLALDLCAAWIKALRLLLKRIPRKWLYRGGLTGLAIVGGIWFWRALDLDGPVIEGRRLLPERRIKLPTTPDIYAVERGSTLPVPILGIDHPLPTYSSRVEFLHSKDFSLPPKVESLLARLEYPTGDRPDIVKFSVPCLMRPLAKESDFVRMIPVQELAPGLYSLAVARPFAVEPEKYKETLIKRAEVALKDNRWNDALAAMRTWMLLAFHQHENSEDQKRSWAEDLIRFLKVDQQIATADFIKVTGQAVEWQPTLNQAVSTLCLSQAERVLKQGCQRIPEADTLLRETLRLDPASSQTVAVVAWNSLAQWVTDPTLLGKDGFYKLWAYCETETISEKFASTSTYQLAQALKLFDQGDRAQALLRLKSLALAPDGDGKVSLVARRILAPPETGSIPIGKVEPVIFQSRTKNQEGMKVELLSTEIGTQYVLISLSARNSSAERMTLLFAKPAPGNVGPLGNSSLYLLDDNGRKFDSDGGYIGGRQISEGVKNAIELEPGEETILFARFPMVSSGATQAQFVSPECRGQGRWSLGGIRIKSGPFELPLPTRPLLHPDLAEPNAVPVAVSPTPSPTTPISSLKPADVSRPVLHPKLTEPNAARSGSSTTTLATTSTSLLEPTAILPTLRDESLAPNRTIEPSATTDTQNPIPPNIKTEQTPVPGDSVNSDQMKMTPIFSQAKSLRQQYLKLRQQHRVSKLQERLFEAGEQTYHEAEQARIGQNFSKASLYYEVAIDAYQKAIKAR